MRRSAFPGYLEVGLIIADRASSILGHDLSLKILRVSL